MGFFLPYSALPHLKEYKYQSEDRSLLTKYVLKKFWVRFECIFPLWMAPNMVTLSGLYFIIASLLLVFYIDPDLNKESSSWVYVFHAFTMFMYQTFDACDGIHARRTGQSGPLGELFDHCVDAINTTLSVIIFGSVANLGKGWCIILSQFAALMNFYLSTWEEYHTHKLYLSPCSGPVEGICLLTFLYLVTAALGVEHVWKFGLFTLDLKSIGLSSEYLITSTEAAIVGGGLMLWFNIESARSNVIKYVTDKKQQRHAMTGLIPFFVYYASVFIMLFFNEEILTVYTLPTMLTIGSTIAFTVGRIIIGHLSKMDFPYINFPMLLPTFQMALIWLLTHVYGFQYEEIIQLVVYLGLGLALGIHGMFILEIITEITTYLDIYALSIKHQKIF
ncbi:hypothetical protein CANARDRAFT_28750 [[Candida] arabinofermentans NRRL YB-2248]|uniref:Uncharacterized protein n=1 Tax=[Candida] arabinofermentans NRRL YB-2248 TaxID=983967 RepID=A0A1E4SZV5_9ASCO|nr:hypothetical protein CANARDRAFT_28750 [[Candida] arabinofermentans NRRL YB-2248]